MLPRKLLLFLFLPQLLFVRGRAEDDEEIPSRSEYLAEKDLDAQMGKLLEKDHKQIKDGLRQDIKLEYGVDLDFKHAPVDSINERLDVKIGFHLIRIHVDEAAQRVRMLGGLSLFWSDPNLIWDPKANHNITHIRLHPHSAWVPPVHAITALYTHREPPPDLVAYANGVMMYSALVTIMTFCPDMDYGNFPFDQHNCTMAFYIDNWGMNENVALEAHRTSNHTTHISMLMHGEYTKSYSLQWQVLDAGLQKTNYDNGKNVVWMSFIQHWVTFVRRAPYYGAQLLFPQLLSSSFLFVAWLYPLGHKGRFWMIWASVIAIGFCQIQIYNHLPPASFTRPKIVRFSLLVCVLQLLSLLESVIFGRLIVYLKSRFPLPPPIWIGYICDTLATMLCYSNTNLQAHKSHKDEVMLIENPCYSSSPMQSEFQIEDGNNEDLSIANRVCDSESEWCRVVRLGDRLVFVIFIIIYLFAILILLF